MNCCQCNGIEDLFNEKLVSDELAEYRVKGPKKTTRMLIDALKSEGVQGLTLLDIGGGVGAVQQQLIEAGVHEATDVDAAKAYTMPPGKRPNGAASRIGFAFSMGTL